MSCGGGVLSFCERQKSVASVRLLWWWARRLSCWLGRQWRSAQTVRSDEGSANDRCRFPRFRQMLRKTHKTVRRQKRDTEQAAQDREQAKKDAEQDRKDHMQELYDDGRQFLDEEDYGDAVKMFSELAALNGPQADAALYWKAYAENRQGKREAALATTADLKRKFPQSRWKKDAEALEIEVKQRSGATVDPQTQSDQDLKFLALEGIMRNDPARGTPLIAKYLAGPGNPKEKSKALFVLAQTGSPQAQETLRQIALGQSNPELQRKAVEYLSIFGGKGNKTTLQEVYTASNDPEIKRAVIRGYMIAGDREHLSELGEGRKGRRP